jgi:hypothetical protein
MVVPIYIINLDRDVDRYRSAITAFEGIPGFRTVRINAVSGRELPEAICHLIAQSETWAERRGEIGCFLSHVKAWEAVATSAEPYSIIVEDDATSAGLELIRDVDIPDGADLVFLNARMSPGRPWGSAGKPPAVLPISASFENLAAGGGVGADGYLITPNGAIKLLSAIKKDYCFGHVDWRILRYCVSIELLEGRNIEDDLSYIIKNHHNPRVPPAWGVINGFCLSEPLIIHSPGGHSSRDRENLS